jgi:hypothetical protein
VKGEEVDEERREFTRKREKSIGESIPPLPERMETATASA